jgi:membrane protease YdiL (CAAX protease family)
MASPVRVFFRLAFGLSWGAGALGLVAGLTTSSPLYYAAAYSISISGLLLTFRYAGAAGLRGLASRLHPLPLQWPSLVIAGYFTMATLAWRMSGGEPMDLHGLPAAILRDPGPLGEEFGWRGFALPRLLQRLSPLQSSLLLGSLHALWHAPLFFIDGMPQQRMSIPAFTLGLLSMAIFDTALYLRARGNLLLAILVHLMANAGATALGPDAFPHFALAQAAIAIWIAARFMNRSSSTPEPACPA